MYGNVGTGTTLLSLSVSHATLLTTYLTGQLKSIGQHEGMARCVATYFLRLAELDSSHRKEFSQFFSFHRDNSPCSEQNCGTPPFELIFKAYVALMFITFLPTIILPSFYIRWILIGIGQFSSMSIAYKFVTSSHNSSIHAPILPVHKTML